MGRAGFLALEIRTPSMWSPVTVPDLILMATNALALACTGEPPEGFRFTQDERYVEAVPPPVNPFERRRRA